MISRTTSAWKAYLKLCRAEEEEHVAEYKEDRDAYNPGLFLQQIFQLVVKTTQLLLQVLSCGGSFPRRLLQAVQMPCKQQQLGLDSQAGDGSRYGPCQAGGLRREGIMTSQNGSQYDAAEQQSSEMGWHSWFVPHCPLRHQYTELRWHTSLHAHVKSVPSTDICINLNLRSQLCLSPCLIYLVWRCAYNTIHTWNPLALYSISTFADRVYMRLSP